MSHDTFSDIHDVRLCDCQRYPSSLRELERRGVCRPLKYVGRVVLIAAPLLACAVLQTCWTSLCGIGRRRRCHCNHRAHIEVSFRDCPRRRMALSKYRCQIIVATRGPDHRQHATQMVVGLGAAAKLNVQHTFLIWRAKACGCVGNCMFASCVAGCFHTVGRRLLSACIPVMVACTLFVGCRSSASAGEPTGEAAFAVCVAGMLLDGVCGCVRLFAVVCRCHWCQCLLLLQLVFLFLVVAVFVGGVP